MPLRRPRPRRDRAGFAYSRWDGTQRGFDLDADALFDEMSDDLAYHGDLNAALRRLMQQGMRDRDGESLMGLREMMQRLRDRRREMLERYDLGGVYEDIGERLRDIVDQERRGLQDRDDELADDHRAQLDALSPDLAAKMQELQHYEWVDDGARQRFEALMHQLREQLLQSYFSQMSDGMQNLRPERMARIKDMFAELNEMLEQRARGEQPDFDGFMERYGDFFPGNPATLDELLEQMARSMAQMAQLVNSMTPEQQAQLQALAAALLDDMDLRWQVDQLAHNLQQAFPTLPWAQSMPFQGDQPLGFGQLPGLLDALGDLDDLEHLLSQVAQPGELLEVDLDRAGELLGDDAARSLERLADLARMLEDAGVIERREGRLELTPRGIRAIGQRALGELFRRLLHDQVGRHEIEHVGNGTEPAYEHKPYEFGDPFHLNVGETVKNAIWRQGAAGTPVRLSADDFEVERTEQLTRSATVLLLDVSLSMPMRDNFLAAKKVAMALHALITSQYPRDYFGLVSFGRIAREVSPAELPEMSWDFDWGTNMQHALLLARRQLARQAGTRQIIMVTDGEPTAHIRADGVPDFHYPPSMETVEETLKEVVRCTRAGIRINTFMLDGTYSLRAFVERMTQLNRGRAFFTTPDTLGDYVLVDFVEQRRHHRRAG